MTDKEILEYSKQITNIKKNIENSNTTEPDLKELIASKFLEDTVNRAKFIDSTLTIGSASTEFRNVFGVETPHYEISNCYLAVNRNDRYYEDDDILEVTDPMQNNTKVKSFLDSWEMINAARFDSETDIPNFEGDEKLKPVEKQRFFVDSEKGSTGSPIYQPFCPPGYNHWAGGKVYDFISKNYSLDELTLYKILNNGIDCTSPIELLEIDFNGDNKFVPNSKPSSGKIVNGEFVYEFEKEANYYLLEKQRNGEYAMPYEGCKPSDKAPVTYVTINVPVTSNYINGKYYYTYDRDNTIFGKTRTPIVNFSLRSFKQNDKLLFTLKKVKKTVKESNIKSNALNSMFNMLGIDDEDEEEEQLRGDEFNKGIALLCEDPFQSLPAYGSSAISSYPLRFTFNVITSYNDLWDSGDTEKTISYSTTKSGMLWWKSYDTKQVTTYNYHEYGLFISPIKSSNNSLPDSVKKFLVKNILTAESEYLDYDYFMKERGVINNIPDTENSVSKSKALLDACIDYLKDNSDDNYSKVVNALRDRAFYDIYMRDPSGAELENLEETFLVNTIKEEKSVNISYSGTESYISGYNKSYVSKWPYWLSILLKKLVNTPIYSTRTILAVDKTITKKNIDYNTKRDFTSDSDSSLMTLSEFLGNLDQYEIKYLKDNGILIDIPLVGKYLHIDGVTYKVNDTTVYRINTISSESEELPFDNIKRALTIDNYIRSNPDLYKKIFSIAVARLDKRNGTLRETCSLLENTNVDVQMNDQKKRNMSNLLGYINSYNITSGFGSKEVTISLATWEPAYSAYSSLERLSTVYLLCDSTKIKDGEETFVDNGFWIKTKIVDIIDLVSDTINSYVETEDTVIQDDKQYYEYNYNTDEYEPVSYETLKEKEEKGTLVLSEVFERGTPLSGPVFKVTLQDELPLNFKNKNAMLTKIY